MNIQECYQQLGGDFAQVEKRLSSEALVRRFLAKFLDDGSFSELCIAMEDGDRHKAFRGTYPQGGQRKSQPGPAVFLCGPACGRAAAGGRAHPGRGSCSV